MYINWSPLLLKMCLLKTELVCKCLCKKKIITYQEKNITYQPDTPENFMYQRRTIIPFFFKSLLSLTYPEILPFPIPYPILSKPKLRFLNVCMYNM